MDDFDRDFRNMNRLVYGIIVFTGIVIVAIIAGYIFIASEVIKAGPEGIAASAGRAVKAFKDASH